MRLTGNRHVGSNPTRSAKYGTKRSRLTAFVVFTEKWGQTLRAWVRKFAKSKPDEVGKNDNDEEKEIST